jgi:hypothetical protein
VRGGFSGTDVTVITASLILIGDDASTIILTTLVVHDLGARRGALLSSVDTGVVTP